MTVPPFGPQRLVNASNGKPRVALITGSARGNGRAGAIEMGKRGASVAVSDLPAFEKEGQEAVAAIKAFGSKAIWVPLDVAKEDQWVKAIETIEAQLGPLDILVNNAGIARKEESKLEDVDMSGHWRVTMAVNLDGPMMGMKHGIRSMLKNDAKESKSIVNISSVAGLVGTPPLWSYSASKGGLRLLTKSAALYCRDKKYGIRVNSIHPGPIATNMTVTELFGGTEEDYKADYKKAWGENQPIGEPLDVGMAMAFLAGEESRFMTGSELVIDGAKTAW